MKKYEIGLKRRKAYKKIDELLTLLSERFDTPLALAMGSVK